MLKHVFQATTEGLPTFKRRTVLAGALATGAAATSVEADESLDRPSQVLVDLINAVRAADADAGAALAHFTELEKRFDAWKVRAKIWKFDSRLGIYINPTVTDRDLGIEKLMDCRRALFERISTALIPGRTLDAVANALEADLAADCADWCAIHNRIERRRAAIGLNDAEIRHAAALDAVVEAQLAALKFPARTTADVVFKAAWLKERFGEHRLDFAPEYGQALLDSFVGADAMPT